MATAPASYEVAGRRHLEDGRHLVSDRRHISGDHLIGLSAECLLKAMLTGYLGATVTGHRPPRTPDGKEHKHLPELWTSIGSVVGGRSASQFAALMAGRNPFAEWSIHDRYADGTAISMAQVHRRLNTAEKIASLHQQAVLNGVLP